MKVVKVSAWVRWCIVAVYVGAVTKLSLSPSSSLRLFSAYMKFPHSDKVVHFIMYGVLAALLVWAMRTRVRNRQTALAVVGVCLLYGLLMEVMQMVLLPGDRFFCVLDVGANTLGAAASVALLALPARGVNGGSPG